ncbi:MAG: M61 family metallopeptidase [Planctomycetaceae bacterium]|nr:M61 family metallopeptidase [Planctomycetaceae bacterium]MDG2105835.1 PDZ domain-containing protein [Pirellulaceae bacterium]
MTHSANSTFDKFKMQRALKLLSVIGLVSLISTASISAQEAPPASLPSGPTYQVDLTDVDNHYVTVTMTVHATGPETELMMATWTPGSYLVREYAKHIDRITATAGDETLPIIKTRKNRWTVSNGAHNVFQVTYRLFCKDASVRTNFADNTYCVLNGAATFLTIPEQMESPHEIQLELPAAWTGSSSSMHTVDDDPNHYVAANFDELVDSPLVAGLVEVYPFEVAGIPHYLVNVNDEGNWDGEKATADLKKMVAAHHEFWGTIPYDRYYFLNVLNDTGGGLEHDHSCLMMTSQRSMRRPSSYRNWLSLCSHEFFHTWNIRRLRPRGLVKYDYEVEAYTPSLWIAEGITSYYEDLLLVRSGLLEPKDFVKILARQIRGVQKREGRKVQSLRDSSHDAWIKFYRPEENSRATQVSYYSKGAVAGFLLDMEIRAASAGQKSLDDAMRMMYEKYAETGYLPADFRAICSELANQDLTPWFTAFIDSTDELDFQTVADWLAMQIGDALPKDADKSLLPAIKLEPWIGLEEESSPASEAGLKTKDEVLAVNGKRLKGDLEDRIKDAEIDEKLNLLIDRNGNLKELELTVGSQEIEPAWKMQLWKDANVRQRVNRYRWFSVPEVAVEAKATPLAIYKWTKVIPEPKKLPLQ